MFLVHLTTYFSVLAVAGLSFVSIAPKLIWNASASAPIGLYTVQSADRLDVTDLVAVAAPEPIATFLADGGYLSRDTPLLKRVLGLPGQTVWRRGGPCNN